MIYFKETLSNSERDGNGVGGGGVMRRVDEGLLGVSETSSGLGYRKMDL